MTFENKMSSRKISTTSRKRVKREEPSEPTRRSSRVVGVKAEYDGSTIDALLDEDEENENGRARKRASVDAELDDDELTKDVVATSREWLAEAREKLLATRADVANSFVEKSAKDEAWRRDAMARWGDSVPSAAFRERLEGVDDVSIRNASAAVTHAIVARSITRMTRGSC